MRKQQVMEWCSRVGHRTFGEYCVKGARRLAAALDSPRNAGGDTEAESRHVTLPVHVHTTASPRSRAGEAKGAARGKRACTTVDAGLPKVAALSHGSSPNARRARAADFANLRWPLATARG